MGSVLVAIAGLFNSLLILIVLLQGWNREKRLRALEGKMEEMEDKNRE
jgi:hypothetical protein